MSGKKPMMESKMQIVHLELVQKAPLGRKKFDIFHATCYPITVLEGHAYGWEKLKELGHGTSEECVNKLAEEYGKQMETFKTVIPMTRNTVELNDYEPGKSIVVFVAPLDENKREEYIEKVKKDQEGLFKELSDEQGLVIG